MFFSSKIQAYTEIRKICANRVHMPLPIVEDRHAVSKSGIVGVST